MVRISGSHPEGPGSIPGTGKISFFKSHSFAMKITCCLLGLQSDADLCSDSQTLVIQSN